MTVLTVGTISVSGVVTNLQAVSSADEFANDGRTFLDVNNGSGSSVTVTFTTPGTVGGIAIENPANAVAAGTRKRFGPFDPSVFNAADGNVDVAFSATTTITAEPVRM